jgi:hypothetical protein
MREQWRVMNEGANEVHHSAFLTCREILPVPFSILLIKGMTRPARGRS